MKTIALISLFAVLFACNRAQRPDFELQRCLSQIFEAEGTYESREPLRRYLLSTHRIGEERASTRKQLETLLSLRDCGYWVAIKIQPETDIVTINPKDRERGVLVVVSYKAGVLSDIGVAYSLSTTVVPK